VRWRKGRRSTNIEDRRGHGPIRMGRGVKLGGGLTILAIVAALLLGQDPASIVNILGSLESPSTPLSHPAPGDDEAADFVSVALADTEDTWSGLFTAAGERYPPPKLVLYSDVVR